MGGLCVHVVGWRKPTHQSVSVTMTTKSHQLMGDRLLGKWQIFHSLSELFCCILIGVTSSYDLSQLRESCRCRLVRLLNVTPGRRDRGGSAYALGVWAVRI